MERDKILTISIESYVASRGKNMGDYNVFGVENSAEINLSGHLSSTKQLEEKVVIGLLEKLPADTEAVVDIRRIVYILTGFQYISYIGTALIPKK